MKIRQKQHNLCAICDETNLTSMLCDECAKDEANIDWVMNQEEEISVADPGTIQDRRSKGHVAFVSVTQMINDGAPRKRGRPSVKKDKVIMFLADQARIGRTPTPQEVAKTVGCTYVYAWTCLRELLGNN